MKSPAFRQALVSVFLIPIFVFEPPAIAEGDTKIRDEPRDLKGFAERSRRESPVPYRLRRGDPATAVAEFETAFKDQYEPEEVDAMDRLSDAALYGSPEVQEHALNGEIPIDTPEKSVPLSPLELYEKPPTLTQHFQNVSEVVARPLSHMMETSALVLSASIASMVSKEWQDQKIRKMALLETASDRNEYSTQIDRLAPYERRQMHVPLGPNGELILGASSDKRIPWQSFSGVAVEGRNYPDAKMGYVDIFVVARGEVVEVEKLYNAKNKEIPLFPGLMLLENPLPDRGLPEVGNRVTKTCDNELYQNRCITVFPASLPTMIASVTQTVLNVDTLNSIVGAGTAGVSVNVGVWSARHMRWFDASLLWLAKMLQTSVGAGYMNAYVRSCVSMIIPWGFWEGGSFLPEIGRILITNRDLKERSRTALLRLGGDLVRFRIARNAGNENILGILGEEVLLDTEAIHALFSKMGLVVSANHGFFSRFVAQALTERILTFPFFISIGVLATPALIRPALNASAKAVASRVGNFWATQVHKRESLWVLQDAAKSGTKQLGEWGLQLSEREGAVFAARWFTMLGGRKLASWAGKRFMQLVGFSWVATIFICVSTVADMMPAEHKFVGTTLIKESLISVHAARVRNYEMQIADLFSRLEPLDFDRVRPLLAGLQSAREGMMNQLSYMRSTLLDMIAARDYEIRLAEEGLINEPKVHAMRGLDVDPADSSYSGPWSQIRFGMRHEALEQMLHEGHELSEANRAIVYHLGDRMVDLYNKELLFFIRLLYLPLGTTMDLVDRMNVPYDDLTTLLERHFAKYPQSARLELARHFLMIVMNRAHVLDLLQVAPESKWKKLIARYQINESARYDNPKIQYRDPYPFYWERWAEEKKQKERIDNNDPYEQFMAELRDDELNDREHVRYFGWSEKDIANWLVEAFRKSEHPMNLDAFPKSNEEWDDFFGTKS